MAPCFRFRRALSKGGFDLSVAYDLICLVRFFELYKLGFKSASMRLCIDHVSDLVELCRMVLPICL